MPKNDWFALALEAEAEERIAEALACLEAHLRDREAETPPECMLAATVYTAAFRFDEALRALKGAGRPGDPEMRVALLECWISFYRANQDLDAEEAKCRELIAARPDLTAGWVYLGGCLARRGLLLEAEDAYGEAKGLEGDLDEVALNLALVQRAQGRFADAAESAREALRLNPQDEEAQEVLRDLEAAIAVPARAYGKQ